MLRNNLESLLTQLEQFDESSDHSSIAQLLDNRFDVITNSIFEKWTLNTILTGDESTYIDLLSALEFSLVEHCTARFNTNSSDQDLLDKLPTCFFRTAQLKTLTNAVIFVRDQEQQLENDQNDQMLVFLMRMLDARTLVYRLCSEQLRSQPEKLNDELLECLTHRQAKHCLLDMIPTESKKTKRSGIINSRHRFFVGCCTFAVGLYGKNAEILIDKNKYICLLTKYVRTILKKENFDKNQSILYCLRGILALLTNCIPTNYWLQIINRALANENDIEAQQENPFNIDLFSCLINRLLASDILRQKVDQAGTNDATRVLDIALIFLDKWCYSSGDTDDDDEQETSATPSEPNQVLHFLRSDAAIGASQILLRYVDAKYDRLRLMGFALLAIVMNLDDFKAHQEQARELLELIFGFIQQAATVKQYKGIGFDRLLRYLHTFLVQDLVKKEIGPYLTTIVAYAKKRELCALMILRKLSCGSDMKEELLGNGQFKAFLETGTDDLFHGDSRMTKILAQIRQNLVSREEIDQTIEPPSSSLHGRRLFISYSHQDKEKCTDLFGKLTRSDLFSKIWIDREDIRDNIVDTIASGIRQSNIVLILLSDSYVDSDYCRREWTFAQQIKRKIFPIIIQKNFKVNKYDWVLFYIGNDYYYKIEKNEEMKKLFDHLKNQNHEPTEKPPSKQKSKTTASATILKNKSDYSKKTTVAQWTSEDIYTWCIDHKLDKWCSALATYDGHALIELQRLISTVSHVELFVRVHELDVFDVAQFKSELGKILPTQTVAPRRLLKKKRTRTRRPSKASSTK